MKGIKYILISLAVSCLPLQANQPSSEPDTWFMVISDIHTSNDRNKMLRMETVVSDINNGRFSQVDFLVITGDCVSSFLEDRESDHHEPSNNRVIKLMNVLGQLEKPFYLVMGNHEYKIDRDKDSDDPFTRAEIDTIEAMWKRYTGLEPYYSFRKGEMNYLVLNSMRGRPDQRHFDKEQLEWLRKELSTGEPVILFFHHPVRTDHPRIWGHKRDLVTTAGEPEFMNLISEHRNIIRGIFVGHGHRWVRDNLFKEIPVYETSSFGERPKVIGYLVGVNSKEKIIVDIQKLINNE